MKVTLVRHGKTAKAENDRERQLTDVGVAQAKARRQSLDNPTFDLVVASKCDRVENTVKLIGGTEDIVSLDALYPATGKFPTIDDAFNRLAYSTLVQYLADTENGVYRHAEATATSILDFGWVCWNAIKNAILADSNGKMSLYNGEVLVGSHAVTINAIALCAMMGSSNSSTLTHRMAQVMHAKIEECECIVLTLDHDFNVLGCRLMKDAGPMTPPAESAPSEPAQT
jgi:broad specificity phosphatase PhoE